jgi:hypothetical protein
VTCVDLSPTGAMIVALEGGETKISLPRNEATSIWLRRI